MVIHDGYGWLGPRREHYATANAALDAFADIRGVQVLFPRQERDDAAIVAAQTVRTEPARFLATVDTPSLETCRFVNRELLRRVREDPSGLRELHPRVLEQVVAELFAQDGAEVELTPYTRDDGRDLLVRKHSNTGSCLYLVECKRVRDPVGVSVVRGLWGVVDDEKATGGVIVTTATFTQGAKKFASQHAWRLNLKDFDALSAWLRAR